MYVMNNFYPENYRSILSGEDTQKYIKFIKDTFEEELAFQLGLTRVSAPMVVSKETGLNDELSGNENPISFLLTKYDKTLEIIQSLAKWKRNALYEYNLSGLYTDMNAIRPNEILDNLHSLYVDQWDWEKVIKKEHRNIFTLKDTVYTIYDCFINVYKKLIKLNPGLKQDLPKDITFITSQNLLDMYPDKDPKEREYLFLKEYKAAFILGIGKKLTNGTIHDTRAADYDDWNLNGDFLLYYDVLDCVVEISSMGIRVDKDSLTYQLKEKGEQHKFDYQYHKDIIDEKLPYTIGGGIGQSRLCMFLLRKAHIGEVQASYWDPKEKEKLEKLNIKLL